MTVSREALARPGRVLLALIGPMGLAFGSGCVGGVQAESVDGHATCGVPAGHRPPPGDCHALRHHAPADACLVYGE